MDDGCYPVLFLSPVATGMECFPSATYDGTNIAHTDTCGNGIATAKGSLACPCGNRMMFESVQQCLVSAASTSVWCDMLRFSPHLAAIRHWCGAAHRAADARGRAADQRRRALPQSGREAAPPPSRPSRLAPG